MMEIASSVVSVRSRISHRASAIAFAHHHDRMTRPSTSAGAKR